MEKCSFRFALVKDSVFENVNLQGSSLEKANFKGVKFVESDLRRVNTSHAVFTNVSDEKTAFYGKKPWGGESYHPEENIYQAGNYDG